MTVTYTAIDDFRGAYVPTTNKRRFLVLRFVNGKFAWVCGAFSSIAAAEKRAAELNLNAERS
jgi:hypothetical protein